MKSIRIVVWVFLIININSVYGRSYYVSRDGSDSNEGSHRYPIASIENGVNKLQLSPGDSILFRKGDIFFGQLTFTISGSESQPIFIGSYGTAIQKPLITGAKDIPIARMTNDSLLAFKGLPSLQYVYKNKEIIPLARTPNNNYFRVDEDSDSLLIDSDLALQDIDFRNAQIKVLTRNWQWEIRKIVTESKFGTYKLDSLPWRSLRKGYGYYLENKSEFLDAENEWFYSDNENTLYIKSNGDTTANYSIASLDKLITFAEGVGNYQIKDISLAFAAEAGIYLSGKNKQIEIVGCEISNIEVFGIFANEQSQNLVIAENEISDIRGKGIELVEPQKALISKNTIRKIGLIPGYGFDGVNNGTAIAITNREFRSIDDTIYASKNRIVYNRIDSTGYNGIRMDGQSSVCGYNVVTNVVLNMNDGAAIYCWAFPDNHQYTTGNTISNNLIKTVVGNNAASAGSHRISAGIYLDNFSNNISVSNNYIINTQKGILVNDASYGHKVFENVLYDNEAAISIEVYKKGEFRRGEHEIFENMIYIKDVHHDGLSLVNKIGIEWSAGNINHNTYFNIQDRFVTSTILVKDNKQVHTKFQHESWKESTGHDIESVFNVPATGVRTWELRDRSILFINYEDRTVFNSRSDLVDVNGEPVDGFSLGGRSARVFYTKE